MANAKEVKEEVKSDDVKKKITRTIVGSILTWAIPGLEAKPTLDATKLNDDIRAYAMMHGLGAKVTDSAALKKGATPEQKGAAMFACIETLLSGKWDADRTVSIGGEYLMAAMNELKPGRFADAAVFAEWVKNGAAAAGLTSEKFIANMEANKKLAPLVEKAKKAALIDVKFDSDKFLSA